MGPFRTFMRCDVVSDRKIRYEIALAAAIELFEGSRPSAERWLRAYVRGLGAKPVDLLDSNDGLQKVLNIIGRLEHGIFT